MLNLGSIGGYQLPYYTKEQVLTKKKIFEIFERDQNLLKYLPDNPKLDAIPREYLLSILANVKREEYAKLYSAYKEIKSQRSTIGKKYTKLKFQTNFWMD